LACTETILQGPALLGEDIGALGLSLQQVMQLIEYGAQQECDWLVFCATGTSAFFDDSVAQHRESLLEHELHYCFLKSIFPSVQDIQKQAAAAGNLLGSASLLLAVGYYYLLLG
jgi:hypothetical protein